MAKAGYARVLLKLSGEALMGPHAFGIDSATLRLIADQIRKNLVSAGYPAKVSHRDMLKPV